MNDIFESHGSLLKPAKLNTAVAVELVELNKWYGDFHVLRDINLKVMSSFSWLCVSGMTMTVR